jgi:hypothetical protein
MDAISVVKEIMTGFAESTGLSNPETAPRRYLWTDAFAVCNFLELYRQTGDESWRQMALLLVDQVHFTLGRHRKDDMRTGWISGLKEEEGRLHPATGGLRIGKQMNERKFADPYDDLEEWDRDGQYYHYLTKWMHALNRVSLSAGDPIYNLWAIELAKAAHAGFVHSLPSGSKRMFWKMSIDLSHPLIASMGHHDPLDGWITYEQLRTTRLEFSEAPDTKLESEIADMEELCKGANWATADPLGIGGLLSDSFRVFRLKMKGRFAGISLLNDLLGSALSSLNAWMGSNSLSLPAYDRLAFRELGMSIGLHTVERMKKMIGAKPDDFPWGETVYSQLDRLGPYEGLCESIERFWLEPHNRQSPSWTEHKDINSVMLATSLAPDGFLDL